MKGWYLLLWERERYWVSGWEGDRLALPIPTVPSMHNRNTDSVLPNVIAQ